MRWPELRTRQRYAAGSIGLYMPPRRSLPIVTPSPFSSDGKGGFAMVRDTSRQRIAHCNDSDVRMEDLLLPLHGRSEWELDEAGTQREPRRRGVTGSGLLLR